MRKRGKRAARKHRNEEREMLEREVETFDRTIADILDGYGINEAIDDQGVVIAPYDPDRKP